MSAAAGREPETSAGVNRRAFIAAALALVSGLGAPSRPAAAAGGGPAPAALVTGFADPGAAARVGRVYLREHPSEAGIARLSERLAAALGANGRALAAASPETLIPALAALVRTEYASAPLVRVDGWLLAPSEARLYALAALAEPAAAAD
jgi:hypothetical protein